MRVISFHLFNDFSGSPRVLASALRALREADAEVILNTSAGGVLDSAPRNDGVTLRPIRYRFSSNPAVTIWRLMRSQTVAFTRLLTMKRRPDDIVYVNTILPFGAALGAVVTRRKLIYHYHENAFAKGRMYMLLARLMQRLADGIICVSDFQASRLSRKAGVTVIPNAIPSALAASLRPDPTAAFARRRVLMLSSLKDYKGTREFIALARMLPDVNFTVVINDTPRNIEQWLEGLGGTLPANLQISPASDSISTFYNDASMLVNLTNPRLAVETFGLTAAEAMTAGLPVIVPVTGGIADLVTDGVNGYRIDISELPHIAATISALLSDRELYMRLANGALAKAPEFAEERFSLSIINVFKQLHPL